MLQQAAALPQHYAAWPLLALMALTVYAAFPPALAGAIEEDFGFMSVGELGLPKLGKLKAQIVWQRLVEAAGPAGGAWPLQRQLLFLVLCC